MLMLAAAVLLLQPVPNLFHATPARADMVDLALILMVDVSGSVDRVEARLQRQGYLSALVDPKVVKAIRSGPEQKVALTYIEWAGEHYQQIVVDWMVVSDMASAKRFVNKLAETPPWRERWTSISAAIDYAMQRFEKMPHKAERRVIDISGDGVNNAGRLLEDARAEALKKGVTINGLPIVNDRMNPWGGPPQRDLDKYYAKNVIGGPGAFMIVARGFEDFGRAIRQKLILEISGLMPGEAEPAQRQRALLPAR